MTCCGRPMQQDGNQYVCRKCGAWTDPGTQAGGQH
jgi:ribosomal protein L40E